MYLLGLFALSGALIGGTKGKPFDLESYSNFNWGYAAVGGTIGAFFGFIFNEFILTSETAVYPSFVTTLTKPIIGDTCAATLGLSLDYFSFMSCYVSIINGGDWEPLPITIYKKIENMNFQFSAYGGDPLGPSYY